MLASNRESTGTLTQSTPCTANVRDQGPPRLIQSQSFPSVSLDITKVSLGNIFRGQTGHVWTKDVALRIEVSNAGQDETGPLPVLVSVVGCPSRFEP